MIGDRFTVQFLAAPRVATRPPQRLHQKPFGQQPREVSDGRVSAVVTAVHGVDWRGPPTTFGCELGCRHARWRS
jgi:hypothetical protein